MRTIIEAIASATNLASLVRDETLSLELRITAERTLQKLFNATDRLVTLRGDQDDI